MMQERAHSLRIFDPKQEGKPRIYQVIVKINKPKRKQIVYQSSQGGLGSFDAITVRTLSSKEEPAGLHMQQVKNLDLSALTIGQISGCLSETAKRRKYSSGPLLVELPKQG